MDPITQEQLNELLAQLGVDREAGARAATGSRRATRAETETASMSSDSDSPPSPRVLLLAEAGTRAALLAEDFYQPLLKLSGFRVHTVLGMTKEPAPGEHPVPQAIVVVLTSDIPETLLGEISKSLRPVSLPCLAVTEKEMELTTAHPHLSIFRFARGHPGDAALSLLRSLRQHTN